MILALLSWLGIGCWCVCFWWMHRISSRQDAFLKELHARCHYLGSERDILLSDVVTPLGSAKFSRDRLIVRRIQKRICSVSRNREQEHHQCHGQSPAIHRMNVTKAAIDTARSNFLVWQF